MTALKIKLPPVLEGMCLPEDIEDYARNAVRLNIPDGWKLVPVEPTEEMVLAGSREVDWYDHNARDCYRAMLAATPSIKEDKQ